MVEDPQSRNPGSGPRAEEPPTAREVARAEALRANLLRRKAQARGRAGPEEHDKPQPRRGGA